MSDVPTIVGIGLQSERGQAVAPTTWLPCSIPPETPLAWLRSPSLETRVISHARASGWLHVAMVPGVTAVIAQWILSLEAQTLEKFATVVILRDGIPIFTLQDAKLLQASIVGSFHAGLSCRLLLEAPTQASINDFSPPRQYSKSYQLDELTTVWRGEHEAFFRQWKYFNLHVGCDDAFLPESYSPRVVFQGQLDLINSVPSYRQAFQDDYVGSLSLGAFRGVLSSSIILPNARLVRWTVQKSQELVSILGLPGVREEFPLILT